MTFRNSIVRGVVPALLLLLMTGERGAAAVSPVLPGNITTFAGTGNWDYSGDHGAATQADLRVPIDITFDAAGDLFISDSINEVIRRVDATSGIITTVAGNNTPSFFGDGGPATSASLSNPSGVAVDSIGNLYISDGDNNRVRKVDHQTGIITTIAGSATAGFGGDGGPATTASLNGPAGLAIDSNGNLYIADSHNNAIRKVDATGKITTVAGGTQTTFNTPLGIALDGSGNLYIADSQDNLIRKVVLATGVVSTVAGNGTAGFSGDQGPATNAKLGGPYGVRVDAAGNLYIADFGNNRVRFVSAVDGTISTLAGSGTAGYAGDGGSASAASLNGPSGIALDAQKNVYIADSANNVIRRVTMTPGPIVASPSSLAFDPQGVGNSSAAKTITLRNSSGNTVAFSLLSLSSPDFTQQQTTCGSSLTAGATCTVTIAFTPPVGDWGSRNAALVYGDALGDAPQSVVLTGTGLSGQAVLSATTLAFGNFPLNAAAATQVLTVTNPVNSGSPLYLNGAAISSGNSSGFSIFSSTCGTQLAAGSSCQVSVQFSPAAAGIQSAALNLSTSASTAPASVALSAAVAAPQLSLNPSSLSFASQAVNTASGLQNVILSNTASSATLSISSVALNGANGGDFSFTNSCGQSLAAGATCSMSICFMPTAAGSRSATLTITDNAPGSPHVVNLSGTGTGGAQATVSATGLTFASTNLGTTSAAQTVALSNTGSLPFTISGILLGGANSGDFSLVNGCGSSLAAGASCAVSVAFAPKAVGTRTATITISNSATTRTVTLSGNGVGIAQAVVNTNNLTFAYQNLGTTSTAQSVTLTNPGSAALAIGSVVVTGANTRDFSPTSNCGSSLAAGASCAITVAFTPTADGARAGTLTIANSVAAQNVNLSGTGSGNYSVPGCTVLSFVAGPNPIYTNNPYGITSINANVTCPYEIRINAPNGPLFATGNGYSSTLTGNWVTSGLSFFLQQAGNMTSSGTLANLTVQVKTGQGCIATAFTASPNPIITNNAYGQTTVTAATNCSFDIHIGAPDGPIFQKGRGYRSMLTGNWVSNQMNLYLQQEGDTSPADTLSVLTLVVQPVVSSCTVTTFSAVNNPIITTTRLNTAVIQANANCPYDIRVGSPNGALLGSGQGAMTTQTGNWVVNGLSFFLQLQGNTTAAGTLSTFTVNTELPSQTIPSCAISSFSATPNPLPSVGGSAAVSVNANCAWDLRLNDSAGGLLASGSGAGSATISSVTDGMLVYLQPEGDTSWQHNLSILTLHAGGQSSTCTALVFSSTPIVADAPFGVTNITADATCPYDIRINSPDGGLFGSGTGLTSANTGDWVLFGQVFYLQRRGDTTPAGTLATNAAIIIP